MEHQTLESGHEAFRTEQAQLGSACREALISDLFDTIDGRIQELRAKRNHDIGVVYEIADLLDLMVGDGLNYANWYRTLAAALERMGCEVSGPNADEAPEAPELQAA